MPPARFFNIPRIELATVDGHLVGLQDRPLTESVLIIAPALDGPTDAPVRVNTVGEIEHIFGPISFNSDYSGPANEVTGYSGNDLIKCLREVQSGGAAEIRLMRVGGTTASGFLDNQTDPGTGFTSPTGTILFTSEFGGRIYNKVSIVFTSGTISGSVQIIQPTTKGGTFTIGYSLANSGFTVAQLIDSINSDPRNQTIRARLGTANSTALARFLQGTATLGGGTDGTIKDDLASNKYTLYDNLTRADTGTFDLLSDYTADVIFLGGIYLDDQVVVSNTTTSVAQAFANFLGRRTVDYPIIGVIGVRPLDDPSNRVNIVNHFNALMNPVAGNRGTNWLNAGYFMNLGFNYADGTLEQAIDAGAYLQVVAADVVINDPNIGFYVESAAGIYAGTITALKPQNATTYKRINGILSLPYLFTRAQLDQLCGGVGRDPITGIEGGGAYVTLIRIEGRGILFTKDVTASQRNSDFRQLQTLRIVNSVHKGIKDLAFPYLGTPNTIQQRTSLKQSITTFMDAMADAEALLGREGVGYFLDVSGGRTATELILGEINIDVAIRPAFQIQVIRIRVRVTL